MAKCQEQKHQENANSYTCEHVEKLFFQQISCVQIYDTVYSIVFFRHYCVCDIDMHVSVYIKKIHMITCTVDALFHSRT